MIYNIDCTGCNKCAINSNSEYICYLHPQAIIAALKNTVSLLDRAPQGKYLSGLIISIRCTGQINISSTIIKYVYSEEVLPDKRDTKGYPFESYSVLCAAFYEILELWYLNRQYMCISNNYANCKMIKYSGILRFVPKFPPINKTQVMALIELLEVCDSVYSCMDV